MSHGYENYTVHIVQIFNGSNSTPYEVEISCNYFAGIYSIFLVSWFKCIIYFFYGSVFVVAMTGNGLVCYVVYGNKRMQTVTNYFIVNLAVGDILMAFFCVPPSFFSLFVLQYWPFGSQLCPVVYFLQAVSVLVSAYTLVIISIDRYRAIMWPLKPKLNKRQAKFFIMVVWLLALAISSPIAIVTKLTQPSIRHIQCDHYICQEVWPSTENRYYYSVALMILQYVVPIMVLVFTYTSIAVMVWGKRPPGEAENVRDQRMARSKRKMVKMMMTVVTVFSVCWLPFNILTVLMDNNLSVSEWTGLPFLWMVVHWLAMSHSCYNPVIYCWMNATFRSGFMTAINRLPCVHRIIDREIQRNDNNNASPVRIPLNGINGSGDSVLRRMTTCTAYISVRRQTNGSHNATAKSTTFRNESFRLRHIAQNVPRRLDSHLEEQL
ncbi:RYamide receptor [Augochlora pura]